MKCIAQIAVLGTVIFSVGCHRDAPRAIPPPARTGLSLSFSIPAVRDIVSYYDPVVRPESKEIAYLKRTMRIRFGRDGLPAEASPREFLMDRLELCTARIDLSHERCVQRWELPLEKSDELSNGDIHGVLGWNDSKLLHHITLKDFAWDCEGWPCPRDEWGRAYARDQILENLEGDDVLYTSRDPDAVIWAEVDPDPRCCSSPVPNKIIVKGAVDD